MTQAASWRPLGALNPEELAQARLQAHHALQLPARAAIAFVPPRKDDEHMNFGWVDSWSAFVSHVVPTERGGAQFGIRLADLALLLVLDGSVAAELPLHGQTASEAAEWLRSQLGGLGLAPEALADAPPWDMPAHPVGAGAAYDVEGQGPALAEFCRYYGNACIALETVRGDYLAVQPGPGEIRMWPHHFDIAVLVTLEEADARSARAVGFGFEPGDASCDQPYFFTYPWPRSHRPQELPELVGGGRWTEPGTWFGTRLEAGALVQVAADRQRAVAEAYLRDAAQKCRVLAMNHP